VRAPGGSYRTVRGVVVGRPGAALDADGTRRYYVVGTDRKVYVATQAADGVLSGFTAAGGSGRGVAVTSLAG